MKKPIIGIPTKLAVYDGVKELAHLGIYCDEHRLMVMRNGGIAIVLTPTEDKLQFNESDAGDDTILTVEQIEDLHRQVDLCDGIIMQGGLYSCEYEVEIARYALKKDLPILGTCAGFNNILRALGSNVYENDTPYHNSNSLTYRHPVTVKENTFLYSLIGNTAYEVNSLHTMLAKPEAVEPFATITALSDDGLVEAFEVPDKRFVVALKWHPELMPEDEASKRIFDAFMSACRK